MAGNNKSKEFRQDIADKFVAGLKENGLNWKQGWASLGGAPVNGSSGYEYNGINKFSLAFSAFVNGFKDNRWVTFNQIKDMGCHLERGTHGSKVEYWFPYDTEKKESISWKKYNELVKNGRKPEEFRALCKMHTVFNGDQVVGMPEREVYENKDIKPSEIINKISEGMGVPVINGGEGAYYIPSKDEVHLPEPTRFYDSEEYNATALHELGHATGHPTRLARDQTGFFGDKSYAYEELVAEITSAFMEVHTSIDVTKMDMDNHKAYVNSWIEAIEKSPDVLMSAIKDADKAADYMESCADLMPEKACEKSVEADEIGKKAEKTAEAEGKQTVNKEKAAESEQKTVEKKKQPVKSRNKRRERDLGVEL